MKKIIFFLFFYQLAFSQTRIFDQQSFLELSQFSSQVELNLRICAEKNSLTLPELYLNKIFTCDDQARQSLKNLKDSFKLFTLSSLVDFYGQVENREKISSLLIQIISENISQFRLNEAEQRGGSRGFGICTRAISIGFCTETPTYQISPKLNEMHMAYLKLFDLIPESQCDLGLFPEATVTMIYEIAKAQNLYGSNSNVVVKNSAFMMGPHVAQLREQQPGAQLIKRLTSKFVSGCFIKPSSASATSFFSDLLNNY